MTDKKLDPAYLRDQIVGVDSTFETPFGRRLMVYCDYTASGRCLRFVETYLQSLQRVYANTHTEDDITGRSMSQLLHEAEEAIKKSVNAGPNGRIVACGTGATGAIDKLQQIIGVAMSPATRMNLNRIVENSGIDEADFNEALRAHQPVVFVGPYEHHSNEISWRQCLAETVEVQLDASGHVDLVHLEELLQDPRYQDRTRIGSFSAASNVTGIKTDVRAVSTLLHRYGAIACFDYAACAPYVDIDMNPEPLDEADDPAIDAIFVSPHKFLGGPGSSGVLVFNERIYNRDLPPSVSAGGTVDYVGPEDQDFIATSRNAKRRARLAYCRPSRPDWFFKSRTGSVLTSLTIGSTSSPGAQCRHGARTRASRFSATRIQAAVSASFPSMSAMRPAITCTTSSSPHC